MHDRYSASWTSLAFGGLRLPATLSIESSTSLRNFCPRRTLDEPAEKLFMSCATTLRHGKINKYSRKRLRPSRRLTVFRATLTRRVVIRHQICKPRIGRKHSGRRFISSTTRQTGLRRNSSSNLALKPSQRLISSLSIFCTAPNAILIRTFLRTKY